MKKVVLTFCLLIVSYVASSQLVLGVANKANSKTVIDFDISQVIDSTLGNTTIGKVYLADRERTMSVKLSVNVEKYFTALTRKIRLKPQLTDSILLVINDLSLVESKAGNVLSGKVELTVSYYRKDVNGETFLLKKSSNSAYKRTFGSATPKSFENLIASVLNQNIAFFSGWKVLNQTYHPAFVNKSEIIIQPTYIKNVNDTIYHGSRPITWDDFRGALPRSTRYGAAIFANIAFDLEMRIENQILQAYFTPKVYMVQGMSWARNSSLDPYSLEHERLHFDIAKVAMNRYVKRVEQINELIPDDLQSRIQFEYLEAYREMNRLQEMYDEETRHGTNQLTQSLWRVQVNKWLQE